LNKYINIGLVVVFCIILGWRECSHAEDKRIQEESYGAVIAFKDGERNQIKKSLDLKVQDSFSMAQNIMTNEIALEQLKRELDGYKSITAYLKSEVTTTLRSLEAKYDTNGVDEFDGAVFHDGNYLHKDYVSKNYIRVPRGFKYNDEWTKFSGTIRKGSTMMDSLSIFNKFDATIGYVKPDTMKWKWFKKPIPVVELNSYNPYTKINYVNNVVVKKDKTDVGNILLSKPAMFIYGLIGGKVLLN